jgi:hypothetical protein
MQSSQSEESRRPIISEYFNLLFLFEAQGLYKAPSFLPFYAYTLRCLVPRCCRVSLQPELVGYYSISFLGLQPAEPLFLNPIAMESPQRWTAPKKLDTLRGAFYEQKN